MKWFLLYGISGISALINMWAMGQTRGEYQEFAGLSIFLSFLALVLVGTTLLLIKISKAMIGSDREKVTLFFKPLLYISQFTAIAITLSCGFSVTTMSFFLPALLTGYYLPKITFFIALGAIYASFKVAKVIISVRPKPKIDVVGTAVGRSEASLLWASIDSISKSIGTKAPERIIFTMDDNICVTEASVHSQQQVFSGRSLILSLPLMKHLSKEQALAIIAHEMAHFSGEDTTFSIKFFPIFHDTKESIEEIDKAIAQFGGTGIAALPAMTMLHHFLESFSLIESDISRRCEKEADLKAASVIGHQPMIEALALTHYLSVAWNNCDKTLFELLHKDGKVANNIISIYSRFVVRDEAVEDIAKIIDFHTPHPFHSHPSLRERVEYLGETLNILKQAAAWIPSEPNVLISEIKNIQDIESSLSDEKNRRTHLISEYVKAQQQQQEEKQQAA